MWARLDDVGLDVEADAHDIRSLRRFNRLDDFNREGPGIEVDLTLPAARVIRALARYRRQ